MNPTTTISSATTGTINGNYISTIAYPNNTLPFTNSIGYHNINDGVSQVEIAIFKVVKDEFGNVTSTELIKQVWVEQKANASLDLLGAKFLPDNFDPSEIQIRELSRVTFY